MKSSTFNVKNCAIASFALAAAASSIQGASANLYIQSPSEGQSFDPTNVKVVLGSDGNGDVSGSDVTVQLVDSNGNTFNVYNGINIGDVPTGTASTYDLSPTTMNAVTTGAYSLKLIYNSDSSAQTVGGNVYIGPYPGASDAVNTAATASSDSTSASEATSTSATDSSSASSDSSSASSTASSPSPTDSSSESSTSSIDASSTASESVSSTDSVITPTTIIVSGSSTTTLYGDPITNSDSTVLNTSDSDSSSSTSSTTSSTSSSSSSSVSRSSHLGGVSSRSASTYKPGTETNAATRQSALFNANGNFMAYFVSTTFVAAFGSAALFLVA